MSTSRLGIRKGCRSPLTKELRLATHDAWTDEQINAAIAELASEPRANGAVAAVCKRLSARFGRRVDADSLTKALKRRGHGAAWGLVGQKGTSSAEVVAERPHGGTTRILVCPDAHHPYADDLAWRTFIAAARDWRPDILVIIGDFADCMSVSFHPKDPERKLSLKDEIAQVNSALDEIEALRIPRVEFLAGNHEFRLQRWLWDRAPELYGLIEISELLRIKERGWGWTPYRESLRIGHMHWAHDVGRCGKNAAQQSLTDYGHSLIFGHSHRASVVYQGTVAGDRQVCMNVGTLIDIKSVDYRNQTMATREWQLGFGLVHMTSDGLGFCTFCPIIEGRTVVDGRVISGRS